jgi:hypothetical protein
MFIIRLERHAGGDDPPLVMWLVRRSPARWGPREQALRFLTKGEARRVAETAKIKGAWAIEEA